MFAQGSSSSSGSIDKVLKSIKENISSALADDEPVHIPAELCARGSSAENAQPILYSEELNYLNAHWHDWYPAADISSHRKILGPIIVRAKRMLVDIVWNYILKRYFEREKEFHMNLVRHLNASARYIDARDKELFWQLVSKIDEETKTVTERTDYLSIKTLRETRVTEEQLVKRIEELEAKVSALSQIKQ